MKHLYDSRERNWQGTKRSFEKGHSIYIPIRKRGSYSRMGEFSQEYIQVVLQFNIFNVINIA